MLPKFAGRPREKERTPLVPQDDSAHRKDWMAAAAQSQCAKNLDDMFRDSPQSREILKQETFDKIYEALGAEIEGGGLIRALVVRNEKFGKKTSIFLAIITLGLFYCVRPRDDDTVVVLTKHGNVIKLKVERPPCCPATPGERFLMFFRYTGILFTIFVVPILVQSLITHRTIVDELHSLHLDKDGLENLPEFAKRNKLVFGLAAAVLLFWVASLCPHDYRDRYRRRHMAREIAAAQFVMWGCTCRRRAQMRLFFGKYPSQGVLDLAGNLGPGSRCSPIPPGDLSFFARPSASTLIVCMTIFMSIITGLDTALTWGERSVALEHVAQMSLFCIQTTAADKCEQSDCEQWAYGQHVSISTTFCQKVRWEPQNNLDCAKFGHEAPCCTGCQRGAYADYTSEGTWATFKSVLSLLADGGTMVFTFLAAKYALHSLSATDNIDVLIKRRSSGAGRLEIAKFDNTMPICADFMEYVFAQAKNSHKEAGAKLGGHKTMPFEGDDKSKWCGAQDFELDSMTADWEAFFEKELIVPPETRWTSRVDVPTKCLGIAKDETVLAAWAELPLYPVSMSFGEFLTGGLLYVFMPFGKTRHAMVVTTRRMFYIRYRRPLIPLKCLGVDLRIDIFRHDHDIFYGRMERTKLAFIHKQIHQTIMREQFLPGTVAMQNKFGALQVIRAHGDVMDVYQLVCQLSRNSAEFIDRQKMEKSDINWDRCQDELAAALTKKSPTLWSINPQLDDVVEPRPDIQLSHEREQLVFAISFKDVGSYLSKYYTNTDVVVSTGRIFFWHRSVLKKFDCQSAAYWCCCWAGFLNCLIPGRNLPNSASFLTLPSLLSFSTDLSVDPPSWLEPHHQPLKVPCWETLCFKLSRLISGENRMRHDRGLAGYSCLPRRTGTSAHVQLMWRLKQSAHADVDFFIVHTLRPYLVDEAPESDAEDIYAGLGLSPNVEEGGYSNSSFNDHDQKVETLRKIMGVVQDECNKLLDQIDVLY